MTAADNLNGAEALQEQSGRPRKAPGRVRAMKALNESGKRGPGGRRPIHGRMALAELLKRGVGGDDALGALYRDLEAGYVADLGGSGNLSGFDRGLVKRLVGMDLDWLLLQALRDTVAKRSLDKKLLLTQAMNKNAATYVSLVKAVGGPGRRPAEVAGQITVKRFEDVNPATEETKQ